MDGSFSLEYLALGYKPNIPMIYNRPQAARGIFGSTSLKHTNGPTESPLFLPLSLSQLTPKSGKRAKRDQHPIDNLTDHPTSA
jgi:hypothetical protein